MAHAHTAACLGQHIGRIRHALHTTGNHDVVAAGLDQVMGEHRGLHPGTTQFVNCCRTRLYGNASIHGRLAGRPLAQAIGQNATHNDLFDVAAVEISAAYRLANGRAAEIHGSQVGKAALHAAHWGSCACGDKDVL